MLCYKARFIILPSGLQSCSDDEEIHDDYYNDYGHEDNDGDIEEEEDHSRQ
jgi:hypothetical protein